MEPADAMALVEDRLAGARSALMQTTGGAALCRIGDGAPSGLLDVKRAEGRAAALADARDALRRSPGDLSAALVAVTGRWEDDLRRNGRRGSGGDWIAYGEGGVDALQELAEALQTL